MSNETNQSKILLSSVAALDMSKPFYLSRTFWTNLLMLLSLVFPAVQAWAAENPAAMPIIFGFVNLVLRTVTNKGLSISALSSDGEHGLGKPRPSGSSGGGTPLGLFLLCSACLFLPSCSSEYPFEGSVSYRDPDSGAKGGLVFSPGEKPLGFLRVPIYDPETGELVGSAEISGPLAEVASAK